jgi:hypothetical protein
LRLDRRARSFARAGSNPASPVPAPVVFPDSSEGVVGEGEGVTPPVQGLSRDVPREEIGISTRGLAGNITHGILRPPTSIQPMSPNQLTLPGQRDAGAAQDKCGGKRLGGSGLHL